AAGAFAGTSAPFFLLPAVLVFPTPGEAFSATTSGGELGTGVCAVGSAADFVACPRRTVALRQPRRTPTRVPNNTAETRTAMPKTQVTASSPTAAVRSGNSGTRSSIFILIA